MDKKAASDLFLRIITASTKFSQRIRELDEEQRRMFTQDWVESMAPVDPFRAERVFRRWVNHGFPWPDDLIPELRATLEKGSVEAPDPHRVPDCRWCGDTGTCNLICRRYGDTEPRLYSGGCDCREGERWDAGKRFGEFAADFVRVPYTVSSVLDVDAIGSLEASDLRGTDHWAEVFAERREQRKAALAARRERFGRQPGEAPE